MCVKTLSALIVVKCHLVRESAGFTHGMSRIELDVREKRFNAHASPGITFERPARAETEDGAGIGSRKEGTHAVGRTGGILRPHPGT